MASRGHAGAASWAASDAVQAVLLHEDAPQPPERAREERKEQGRADEEDEDALYILSSEQLRTTRSRKGSGDPPNTVAHEQHPQRTQSLSLLSMMAARLSASLGEGTELREREKDADADGLLGEGAQHRSKGSALAEGEGGQGEMKTEVGGCEESERPHGLSQALPQQQQRDETEFVSDEETAGGVSEYEDDEFAFSVDDVGYDDKTSGEQAQGEGGDARADAERDAVIQAEKEMRRWERLRARLQQEQAERRDVFLREQHKVISAHEKEEAHWAKQEHKFNVMVEHLKNGQRTCEELNQFLAKGSKAMTTLAEQVFAQGPFGTKESGTLREAALAVDLLRSSIYEHFMDMKDRVFADSIKQSMLLSKTMSRQVAALQQAGHSIVKRVKVHRDRVSEAWGQFEKAAGERQKAEMADKPVSKDPFLACRVYEREVGELSQAELQYKQEMSRLFLSLKIDDGRRIDAVKSILLDYLLAQKALLEHAVKFTESAIASVKAVDREQDVTEFVTHADLLLQPSEATTNPAARARTVFEISPPNRDPRTVARLCQHEVAKEGIVMRQGRLIKSNWKEVYVALSTSGFFHYFDDPKSSIPTLSLQLADCTVRPASRSMFSSLGPSADSAGDAVDDDASWSAEPPATAAQTAEPAANADETAEADAGRAAESAEATETASCAEGQNRHRRRSKRRARGSWGSGTVFEISETNRGWIFSSSTVYYFRTPSEGEMHEWVSACRKYANRSLRQRRFGARTKSAASLHDNETAGDEQKPSRRKKTDTLAGAPDPAGVTPPDA